MRCGVQNLPNNAEAGCKGVNICNLRAPMGRWAAEAGEHPEVHTTAYLIYAAERQQSPCVIEGRR